jgi:hypothetical protein
LFFFYDGIHAIVYEVIVDQLPHRASHLKDIHNNQENATFIAFFNG